MYLLIINIFCFRFKNLSVVKTFDSQTALSSKDNIIENLNILNCGTNTQHVLSKENMTSQSKVKI